MSRAGRDVLAGVGLGGLGCAVWLLGVLAVAYPEEATVAMAVVFVVACWAFVVVGLGGEGRRWR